MVIGFDGSRAFAKDRTGTENYSYQLLRALAKIDRNNQYIVYIRTQGLVLQGWPSNFRFRHIGWPRLWTQAGLALQIFKDKLDVLFIPAHTLPLIRKPGLKTVVTVHDLGSEYLPLMHQFKQRIYLALMQRYQLKTVSKIIAVSKATKEDLIKKLGIDPQKITVIYEGYNKNLFKPVKSNLLIDKLKRFGIRANQYLLFVGTIQPRKNLDRIIRAFTIHSANNKTQLVIAGAKGWLADQIYSLPKQLGIEKQVKFLGYVPDQDLPALYAGAKALLFPSLFEGFGLPIIEAQASGCPVLTSNVSSMPEVAGPTLPRLRGVNKGAIFVNPYNIDDIVKGLQMLNNRDTRHKLIKAGFENIKRFSWEKAALETIEVFESLNH